MLPVKFTPSVAVLLHRVWLPGLFTVGVGLTITVTFCVGVQPFAVKVNMYVTGIGPAVVFVRNSLTIADEPLPAASVMPGTAARVQLKAVPAVALVAV